jgi:carbonic anhydrase
VHQNPETKQTAVLGFLFQIGITTSLVLSSIFESIRGVEPDFDLKDLVSNYDNKYYKYYHYIGSFTYPPCTESVLWTVFTKKLTIRNYFIILTKNIKRNS